MDVRVSWRRNPLPRLFRLCLAAATALLTLTSLPALAEDAVQRGDVLEISVAGVPALNQRLRVGLDGKITYPLLGEIEIADLSLSDLGQRLQALLAARNVVRHATVSVAVVEHQPIYVSGDVAKPGEYPYRPGMTVRHVAALAGSIDMIMPDAGGPAAQIAEARGDYGAAAIEFVRQQIRAARLRAELADQERFDRDDAVDALIDPAAVANIISLEVQHLAMDRENNGRQRAYLERMIEASRDLIASLDLAVTQQQHLVDRQTADTARVRALLQSALSDRGPGGRTRSGRWPKHRRNCWMCARAPWQPGETWRNARAAWPRSRSSVAGRCWKVSRMPWRSPARCATGSPRHRAVPARAAMAALYRKAQRCGR